MMVRILVAVVFLSAGSLLAMLVHDGDGYSVTDIRFADGEGRTMSALLYQPDGATAAAPAPAVLAVHGYINSSETQSGYAIELARRGFGVLALDQTGHGYSDPVAFSAGFGGPAGLDYLRSLPWVDRDRIGLEGHSMGGWTVLMAAMANPAGYSAMVLQGSSTGTFGTGEGTADFPRNLLLVFSQFDEFSGFMWGTDKAQDIVSTDKLKKLFATDATVVPGRLYGDLTAGTARQFAMPPVTHPGDHISAEAIGEAVNWFELTLGAPTTVHGQIWFWKEIGTGLALLGLALLVVPVTTMVAGKLRVTVEPGRVTEAPLSATTVVLSLLLPIITFYPLQNLGAAWLPGNSLFPQQITNGILVWALFNGFVSLVVVRLVSGQNPLASIHASGAGRASLAAFVTAAVICLLATLIASVSLIDFRFWVVALKPMSLLQWGIFLCYLLPFTLFFLLLGAGYHGRTGWQGQSVAGASFRDGVVFSAGFVLLLLVQYGSMFTAGSLLINEPLLTIVAIQFVPVMFFVGYVSGCCYRLTGQLWLGATLNGLLITWYMVAGTATHALPFWVS
ncbi:MAG: alpha/beta fold hydrolase [Pseudomonadales bacterium]|nr:alpha/beta fold hydrolase [Pseudomonadales bacterium]